MDERLFMAKKIRLLINLYPVHDTARLQELTHCLQQNISNPLISEIIVLDEGFQKAGLFDHPKVLVRPISKRPTFADFHDHLDPNGFNLLANNDIRFDRTLGRIQWLLLNPYDLLGLTRTEPDGSLYREKTGDSQDAWLFYGQAAPLKKCIFSMGMPGCENRLAFLFFRERYRVLNPSLLIRARHEHLSGSRSYQTADRIPGDYLSTRPVGLLRFHFFRLILKLLQRSKILIVKDISDQI
jgi:hypothetical protein